MYLPPHLKRHQASFGQSGSNSALANRQTQSNQHGGNRSVLENIFGRKNQASNTPDTNLHTLPRGPTTQQSQQMTLSEYNKQYQQNKQKTVVTNNSTHTIVTIKSEKKHTGAENVSLTKATEFWSDIYNFTADPVEKEQLLWNNNISKVSMIKLLQEQGTIKFNPIEYYRNTVESQESSNKAITDCLHFKIIRDFIKFLAPLNVHNITAENIEGMINIAKTAIEASKLTESEKISLISHYRTDLNEYLKTKRPELAFRYGFKYKQQLKYLTDSLEVLDPDEEDSDDEETKKNSALSKYAKELINDKQLTMIMENSRDDKPINFKDLAHIEKTVKKDFKFISNLPYDSKYFTRLFQYYIIYNIIEGQYDEIKDKPKFKKAHIKLISIINGYTDIIEKLEHFLRIKLIPFLDTTNTEKLLNIEKELGLFEYPSMKERIIGEGMLSEIERKKRNDQTLLQTIIDTNYENSNILDLATYVHSISLQINKIPFMIQMLDGLTKSLTSGNEILNAFIEAYTFIVDYISTHQTEFSKIVPDLKKTYNTLLTTITAYLTRKNVDVYEHQMINLYEYLSPLSHFDEKRPKLDQWQKDVFEMMDGRKNVIVIAPTSSGKTALSTYCSLIVKKVLFVVPSPELARQVCGMIRNLIQTNKFKKHISLVTEKDSYHDSESNIDILVGTPGALEMYFVENNIQTDVFDYIVFDEIHQLNQDIVGSELERWIKWLTYKTSSKFLALSACVGNADELHSWWRQFVSDIELVVCNRRFLQQQKFLWNDTKKSLDKIHPLTVCSLEFLKDCGFIQNGVVKSDMAFTPDDLYNLYSNIKSHKDFKDSLHPAKYFSSIRVTLDNCKDWEWSIKEMFQELAQVHPEFVEDILKKYKQGLQEKIVESNVQDLYKLIKELQMRNLLPSILFSLDPSVCQEKFTELVYYLKEEESVVYPFYYEDLQFAQESYNQYLLKEKELDNDDSIEIPDDVHVSPQVYIEQRKKQLKTSEFGTFHKKFVELMNTRIIYSKTKYTELKEKEDIDPQLKKKNMNNYKKQVKYYEKEISRIYRQQEICPVNIYKPHPDFTFLDEYIDTVHVIEYRKQLMDYIKEEKKNQMKLQKSSNTYSKEDADEKDEKDEKTELRKEAYISYDHPFMIGMERGVILYLNRLPTPFQRVAQSLIASTMKLAPVTFSDQSLAFGVNYPIRSVILTGGYINPIVAHQMIGRAGRSGMDPKGYTIYYGVDWQTIIKEKYLEVNGTEAVDVSIWPMPHLWTNIRDKFDLVSQFHLKDYTGHTNSLETKYETFMNDIDKIYDMFDAEFNVELLDDGAYGCMLADVYKNKHLGLQAVFIPYMLEELSRWKSFGYKLESHHKWDIIQVLTCFLNGDFHNDLFSEGFQKKITVWETQIIDIISNYKKNNGLVAVRLEEKVTRSTIPYWLAVSELLSTLHSLCKDRRIKTIISVMFLDIKNRLKKYTF
jgi:hypothetical protein